MSTIEPLEEGGARDPATHLTSRAVAAQREHTAAREVQSQTCERPPFRQTAARECRNVSDSAEFDQKRPTKFAEPGVTASPTCDFEPLGVLSQITVAKPAHTMAAPAKISVVSAKVLAR